MEGGREIVLFVFKLYKLTKAYQSALLNFISPVYANGIVFV